MSTPRRQVESRTTYRCAVPGSRQEAVLSVGRRRIQVQLENQSSGGFAAWCERDPRLKRDDEAYLHTALAKFEVRVAYVTEVGRDSPADAPHAPETSETPEGRFRLGLQVVRELETQFQTSRWQAMRSLVSSEFVLGAFVALFIVAGVAVATAVWMERPWATNLLGLSKSTMNELPPNQVRLQAVARVLGLTDTQRDRLSTVAEDLGTTLQRLDEQWRNDPPEERARKQQLLAEVTRREIMSFLSDEQQERWRATFGF